MSVVDPPTVCHAWYFQHHGCAAAASVNFSPILTLCLTVSEFRPWTFIIKLDGKRSTDKTTLIWGAVALTACHLVCGLVFSCESLWNVPFMHESCCFHAMCSFCIGTVQQEFNFVAFIKALIWLNSWLNFSTKPQVWDQKYSWVWRWSISKRATTEWLKSKRVTTRHLTKMKSAPLGLAGGRWWSLATEPLPVDGDRMTVLIHYERQRWKKVNFFAKKLLPWSLFQHVQTLCMPSVIDLQYTRNTRPCDVVCLQSKHFRSVAPPAKIYARDRSPSRWNMKHFRQTACGCLLHQ